MIETVLTFRVTEGLNPNDGVILDLNKMTARKAIDFELPHMYVSINIIPEDTISIRIVGI